MSKRNTWTEIYTYRLESRIREVYAEAEKDIEAKMTDFNTKFEAKRKIHYQDVKSGKWTKEQYDKWMAGQVFQGKQWQAKKEQIAEVLYNANKIAAKMVNDQKGNVFAANANYQAYLLEHNAGINFGFGLYDSATVVNLIKSDPQVLPYYTPKKSKDMTWNMHNITRQITQGIIQGESLDKIAKRLAKETGSRNMNSMLTNARTGMTMAQNAGRQQRLKEAEGMGIKVHKEWMSTLDGHTRYGHRILDGQKRKLNEPFMFENYPIMFPGDPTAHPSMVYNCRCTLVGDLDDYPSEYERYDNIEGKPIKNMTYTQWENAKKGIKIPEFTQVSIGAAKSVAEINTILNSNNLFRESGKRTMVQDTNTLQWKNTWVKEEVDLTGCDLDSAKSIAAAYEQMFTKYPQLKGKLGPPNAHPVGMKQNTYAWCYIKKDGKVEVNPKWYSNWRAVERQYESDIISGWHPKGTTAESIVVHELGHAVDGLLAREGVLGGVTSSGEYRYASSSLKSTIMKRAAKQDPVLHDIFEVWGTGKDGMSFAVHDFVSEYATKNNQEWFAECFAEYITSANPRVVASEFGKELEKLLEKLE